MPSLKMLLFVSFLGAALVVMILSSIAPIPPPLKIVFLIIALILDLIAAATRYYTYLFIPFYKMKNRTLILSDEEPFMLAPSGNAITRRDGSDVYATSFIKIPIYKSATEMNDEEKVEFARLFSRVVSLSKVPFKLTSQMHLINKDEYINKIRDKLNEVEELYQKAVADKVASPTMMERMKGEVTMWHNLLDSISKVQSHALFHYAMVSASGSTDEEAIALATQQAEEL
ncbi:MAG: hypothetical protein KGH59_04785, partial [Candidatus Micrarchaeota archaeon]|nr:hypothetical protein [Candidatus Micrarchaeota archaeon]